MDLQNNADTVKAKEEIFNLKNKECQENFRKQTSETKELSSIFNSNKDVHTLTKKFLNRLNGFIHSSFKKIRVTERHDKVLENLYNLRSDLRQKDDLESKERLKNVEKELNEKYAEDFYEKIKKELEGMEADDGGWNTSHLWKLKKKLNPRPSDPPTAMKNSKGVLLTNPEEIKEEAEAHFKKVLENKPMNDPNLNGFQKDREELCRKRLQIAAQNKTPDWTMTDLEKVLKYLKLNKSRDPYGFANEVFKPDVAGDDLKLAVLHLMNKIKRDQTFPSSLELCNISCLYKSKGSRQSFDSHRGVFRVTILRSILDRLIYNDMYNIIDENLTDCNVGSRKKRNVRDNIFVLNAVITSTKNKNEDAHDICVYDVQKCFDSLWTHEALNDIYELGFNNDKLPLLYLENLNANVAIKTASGTTNRMSIRNTIMQGTVWAGLLCTGTMNQLGKLTYNDHRLTYKYKEMVDVPPLEMVDDILTINKCGTTSVTLNSTVNTFIDTKKLKLSETKCAKIHLSKKKNEGCPELGIHGKTMKNSDTERYLGEIIHKSGKPHLNLIDRISKGYGIVANILGIINDVPLANRRVQIGLDLRQAWLLNGCLFNSEVWQEITKQDSEAFCKMDHYLLRSILGAHPKSPLVQLYLETSCWRIPDIISCRRMIYLQTILKRSKKELTRKVYDAMKISPRSDDWSELVRRDFEKIGLIIDEREIEVMSEAQYKCMVKRKIRISVFEDLKRTQLSYKKVKNIKYTTFNQPQDYLTHPSFCDEMRSLLYNLRCRSVRGIKDNFHKMFSNTECDICDYSMCDTQEHTLECSVLKSHVPRPSEIKYEHIFGSLEQQREIVILFQKLLEKREQLLEKREQLLEKREQLLEQNNAYRGSYLMHSTGPDITDISC